MTNNKTHWEPVLTDPASPTPWRIGRQTSGRRELIPAHYATWADAREDADALNRVTA